MDDKGRDEGRNKERTGERYIKGNIRKGGRMDGGK
jgi:hypothetical protein